MVVSGKKKKIYIYIYVYLYLDQVEGDFCSARQAYDNAQQEQVTEERDLRPNSQEVF